MAGTLRLFSFSAMPPFWVVQDGEGYWLVPAREGGWDERSPFVGRVTGLAELPREAGALAGVPQDGLQE